MKKISAVVLILVMLFTMSACNIKDVTKMAYMGDDAVTKSEFNFYLMQAKSQAMSMASQNGDTLSTDEDWNTVMIGDVTAAEYVIDTVKDSIKKVLVLKAKALQDGEKITDEDLETVKTQRNSFIEQLGGRYNYEQVITEYGFTLDDVEKVFKDQILAQKASDKYFNTEDDDDSSVSDEEAKAKYESDYVMAKHILIMPEEETEATAEEQTDGEESEAKEEAAEEDSDAATQAAKAKAEEIIAELDGGADFDALMKSYSKDVDADGNLNGNNGAYVFKKGDMVSEFEEAAFGLEVGKYTKEPVKTTYGYHIIMRMELPTQGDEYDKAIQAVKTALAENRVDDMIDAWAEELGFAFNDKAISRVKM